MFTGDSEHLIGENNLVHDTTDDESIIEIRSTSNTMLTYRRNILCSVLNTLVHYLIGSIVFVTLWFAFDQKSFSIFQLHIVLNVIGYKLLLANGILSMFGSNSWSQHMSYQHRVRFHWVIQLLGSCLSITGSALMMREKTVNFNTIHGKLALSAMVFTGISLLNGLCSIYAAELRPWIPPHLTKFSHVLLGTAAFATSMASLCYGFLKESFAKWASAQMSYAIIALTIISSIIVLLVPLKKCFQKLLRMFLLLL